MTQPAFRPLTVGEILDQAFGLYRRYLPSLVVITLICTAIPQIGSAILTVQASSVAAAGAGQPAVFGAIMSSFLVEYLVLIVVLLIASQLAIGASTLVLSEGYLGRELSTGEALRRAWARIGDIVLLSILTSLVIFLGFLLLIVPGVILTAGLAVATPALMIEQGLNANGAMSRSWALTKGSRFRMFAMLFVTFLIVIVVAAGATAVLGLVAASTGAFKAMTPDHPPLGFNIAIQVLGLVIKTFLTPIVYCMLTVAYFDLRVRNEGFDLEMLASTMPAHG